MCTHTHTHTHEHEHNLVCNVIYIRLNYFKNSNLVYTIQVLITLRWVYVVIGLECCYWVL